MRLMTNKNFAAASKAPSVMGQEASSIASADTIYFDGSCGLCTTGVKRMARLVCPHGFTLARLQDPGVAALLGLSPGEIPDEMKLRTRDGRILGGADSLIYISRRIWWARPVWVISLLPGAMWVMRRLYALLAKNRHRISGTCTI